MAAEADWPDSRELHKYAMGWPTRYRNPFDAFTRFPKWMWRNEEVRDFIEWLQEYNANATNDAKAGFYGLDLYSMAESIRAIIDYLDRVDPETARVARERYGCLEPWMENPSR